MQKEVTYKIGKPEVNVDKAGCPILYALGIVGSKWKLPILWHLFDQETTRYNELKRSVPGITNIMLTKSLKELEEDNLVKRKQFDSASPHVEYSLNERGKALLPTLNDLYKWGQEQMDLSKAK